MIVYVVTEGSYSDYHIEAVFTDLVQAKLYLKLHPACEIEEYDTEAVKIDASKIRHEWVAKLSPNGKLLSLVDYPTLHPKEDAVRMADSWHMGGVHFVVRFITDKELERSVVEKVCFDRVAKYKAEYLGL